MAGRPTSYNKEVISLAEEYLETYSEKGEVVPTVVGLCRHINRGKTTVYNWINDKEDESKDEFRDIIEKIDESQHIDLVSGGLGNSMNSAIVKLMLSRHGYTEKQEIDHRSGDGSMSHPGYTIVDE